MVSVTRLKEELEFKACLGYILSPWCEKEEEEKKREEEKGGGVIELIKIFTNPRNSIIWLILGEERTNKKLSCIVF